MLVCTREPSYDREIGFLRVHSVSQILQHENTTKLFFPQYWSDISRGKYPPEWQ